LICVQVCILASESSQEIVKGSLGLVELEFLVVEGVDDTLSFNFFISELSSINDCFSGS
jgi:hypothetical protein